MIDAAPAATPRRDPPPALTGGVPDFASVRSRHERAAPWPYRELDVTALPGTGWRPVPVHEVVLKVHQRCDLACTYCYVYTLTDQSWRDRPALMSGDVWRAAVANLVRHVHTHQLTRVRVVLHGGEPLLFGRTRLAELAREVRASLAPICAVEIGLQTNGVRLDADTIGTLRQHGVMIGVSVDGPPADHDRHRVRRNGRGSFDAVRTALELLRRPENRSSYAGILCTVSPLVDPVACYEQLARFEPPMIDFLLPHANWQHPPDRPHPGATPYADWLIAAFDCWLDDSRGLRVRLFEDVISLLLGGGSTSEQVGLSPTSVLVVESDGAIEQVDALKSAYSGACATGLDVRRDEFDVALADPGIVARQIGWGALSADCVACPIARICGAGHYAHRYDPANGFRNRSVYCDDMRRLIEHVRDRVGREVQQRISTGAP